MARKARIIFPGYPHHIIQRGNRCQQVFFSDQDKKAYLELLARYAKEPRIEFWAYCLMDNHVHFIAVPENEKSFAKGFALAHQKYTYIINQREGWKGYLWQGRFLSYPMDERYLFAAVRYVELNPVRAGIVEKPEDYPWSSARAHIFGEKEELLSDNFMRGEISDWKAYLNQKGNDLENKIFKAHETNAKPLGDKKFIEKIEKMTGRIY